MAFFLIIGCLLVFGLASTAQSAIQALLAALTLTTRTGRQARFAEWPLAIIAFRDAIGTKAPFALFTAYRAFSAQIDVATIAGIAIVVVDMGTTVAARRPLPAR